MWEVEFYKTENNKIPVEDFIKNLSEKEESKIYREIDLLKQKGIYLGFPFTSKIEGSDYKNLWELRIKFSSNNFRIIYFLHTKKTFVLLHGFTKKTNRTPKRELEIAKRRMIEYKNRRR